MDRLLGNGKVGRPFIVSAPAGTGKTTLVKMLTDEFPCVVASISFTTRQPREGEIDGVHYNFVTHDEFEKKIASGDFLEYVKLYGDYYGTSRSWMEKQLNAGKHVVLVIDTQGAALLRDTWKMVSIFIRPPSLDELKHRLISRGTDSVETIERRLAFAQQELKAGSFYDYTIVNEDLNTAYQVLKSIFIAEEHRVILGGDN